MSTISSEPTLSEDELSFIVNMLEGQRALFRRGGSIDPLRNVDEECRYPDVNSLVPQDYRDMYDKFSVAERVVNILPDETWGLNPEIYESEKEDVETEFEAAWKNLNKNLEEESHFVDEESSPIWECLKRADQLSGIGRFGVVLLGLGIKGEDNSSLEKPLPGFEDDEAGFGYAFNAEKKSSKAELLYLRAFDESLVDVSVYEDNRNSRRYGQPKFYNITLSDPLISHQGIGHDSGREERVHWSRVIHVADNLISSEIYGKPRQQSVFHHLLDLRKLYGGSAEMYWQGAYPGISFETHPQLGNTIKVDANSMKDQVQKYFNGLQRYLALTGATAKTLSPQVVDPTSQIERALDAICIKLGIPKRIFVGSERGELASSQDSDTWSLRLQNRRMTYVNPRIIKRFIDRLLKIGVLPIPKEGYHIKWGDKKEPTALEQASLAAQRMQAVSSYIQSGADVLIPPTTFLVKELGYDREEAEATLEEAAEIEEEKMAEEEAKQQEMMKLQQQQQPQPPQGKQPPQGPQKGQQPPQFQKTQPNPPVVNTESEGIWRTTDDGSKIFIKDGEVRAGGPNGPVLKKENIEKEPKKEEPKKEEASPLTDEEIKQALDDYAGTDGAYREVNSYLRGKKSEISDRGKKVISAIDTLFKESATTLEEKAIVYRGMDSDIFRRLGAVPSDYGGEWWTYPGATIDTSGLKGKVIEDKGFMSTSTEKSVAKKFNDQTLLKITVPKGTKVIDTGFRYEEGEVLLNRGTRLQITAVKVKTDDEGYWSAEVQAKLLNDYEGPVVNFSSEKSLEELQGEDEYGSWRLVTNKEAKEAKAGGRKLDRPFRTPGKRKKFAVYTKNDKGNIVLVRFGDPNMKIKRDNPESRANFRSRHSCDDNPGPKWKARYWSCKNWSKKPVSQIVNFDPNQPRDEDGKWSESTKADKHGRIPQVLKRLSPEIENEMESALEEFAKPDSVKEFLSYSASEESVDIDDLVSPQGVNSKSGIKHFKDNPNKIESGTLPLVIQYGDKLILRDGNTRAVAAKELGRSKIRARVVYVPKLTTNKSRCWEGYEPVPGKEPFSEGSCRPVNSKKRKKKRRPNKTINSEGIWRTTEDGSKIFIKDGQVYAGGPSGKKLNGKDTSSKEQKTKQTVLHGTSLNRVKSILSEGIVPKTDLQKMAWPGVGSKDQGDKVYTTDSLEVAKWYGSTHALHTEQPMDFAVFEIEVPDGVEGIVSGTEGGVEFKVLAYDKIPPEWIKAVHVSEGGKELVRKFPKDFTTNAAAIKRYVPLFLGNSTSNENLTTNRIIKLKGNRWRVVSSEGKNLGTFGNEKAAKKRLKQVEYFKQVDQTNNAFCPTGPGGGIDNSCPPKKTGLGDFELEWSDSFDEKLRLAHSYAQLSEASVYGKLTDSEANTFLKLKQQISQLSGEDKKIIQSMVDSYFDDTPHSLEDYQLKSILDQVEKTKSTELTEKNLELAHQFADLTTGEVLFGLSDEKLNKLLDVKKQIKELPSDEKEAVKEYLKTVGFEGWNATHTEVSEILADLDSPIPTPKTKFPASIDKSEYIMTLGGSTGAKLVKIDGELYVLKKGNNAGHLRNEFAVEQLYKAMGVQVLDSKLYETSEGPVKLSRYLKDASRLGDLTSDQYLKAVNVLQKDFALDATLGNWDVIGMNLDNVMVTPDGTVYRIDVAGSLAYRAQGTSKGSSWNNENSELDTLRNNPKNPSAVKVFGTMSNGQVASSIENLIKNESKLMDALLQHASAEDMFTVKNRIAAAKAKLNEYKGTLDIPKSDAASVDALINIALSDGGAKKLPSGFKDKLAFLNPNGIQGSTVFVPMIGGKAGSWAISNKVAMDHLKEVMPPGTKLEGVMVNKVLKGGFKISSKTEEQAYKKALELLGLSSIPKDAPSNFFSGKSILKEYLETSNWPSTSFNAQYTLSNDKKSSFDHSFYSKQKDKLLKSELKAIDNWTGSYSTEIRKAIIDSQKTSYVSESEDAVRARNFMSGLNKLAPFTGIVHRGLGYDKYAEEQIQHIKNAGVGGIWTDDAPHSTSRAPNLPVRKSRSGGLLLTIKTKTGKSVEDMSTYPNELEVVGMPKTNYRILGIHEKPIITYEDNGVSLEKVKPALHVELEEI